MSNETSRVEAAEDAIRELWDSETPVTPRDEATAALAAADADDLTNGIRRVRVDHIAGVLAAHGFRKWGERLNDANWLVCHCGERMEGVQKWQVLLATHQAAVLAAATDGADG